MTIVRVKDKFQVTLPAAVRQQAGIEVGDVMEVTIAGGAVTLRPKRLVDHRKR